MQKKERFIRPGYEGTQWKESLATLTRTIGRRKGTERDTRTLGKRIACFLEILEFFCSNQTWREAFDLCNSCFLSPYQNLDVLFSSFRLCAPFPISKSCGCEARDCKLRIHRSQKVWCLFYALLQCVCCDLRWVRYNSTCKGPSNIPRLDHTWERKW